MKILTFVSGYLPGYKSGGPVRTISNMVDALQGHHTFKVICSDRDLGDIEKYENINNNQWYSVDGADVLYLSPSEMTVSRYIKIFNCESFDVLYLNSFFDKNFSIKPLLAFFLSKNKNKKILLAPRGEFSTGALELKKIKKKLFLYFSKIFKIYNKVFFHASSEIESRDIRNALGVSVDKIKIALDLPGNSKEGIMENNREDKILKLIFISRISRKKNLDVAINILKNVKERVDFDIYGPIEDNSYWEECKRSIINVPLNIKVKYCGEVNNSHVVKLMSEYDIFFFPTKGENFGHVISESLMAGTPVLISDQTPWVNLEEKGLGWEIPLEKEYLFVEKISGFSKTGMNYRNSLRKKIIAKSNEISFDEKSISDNINLFK